jgi:MOSC domain-containing protein YiiM
MTRYLGQIESLHIGKSGVLGKASTERLTFDLDGVVGDRHRSFEREAWGRGDKQAEGVRRRNERQWSAMSVEELGEISTGMNLARPLDAADVGVNISISGVPEFSRLTKGSILKFPSGAELVVVEYNPPCLEMGQSLAEIYKTRSGEPLSPTAFSKAAKLTRGVVGIVDVPGDIVVGDQVDVQLYETPNWLARSI